MPQGAPAGSWGRSEHALKLEDAGQERVGPRRRTEVACCPAGDVAPCPGAAPAQGLALRRPLGAGRSQRLG